MCALDASPAGMRNAVKTWSFTLKVDLAAGSRWLCSHATMLCRVETEQGNYTLASVTLKAFGSGVNNATPGKVRPQLYGHSATHNTHHCLNPCAEGCSAPHPACRSA